MRSNSETKTMYSSGGRLECHPLFNSAILDNLTKFLNVETLKNVRLVCKNWHEKFSPELQNRAWVNMFTRRDNNLTTFVEYLRGVPENKIFFRQYIIDTCHIMTYKCEIAEKFIQLCCPSMKALIFKYCDFTVEFLKNILFSWSPNLKYVEFDDCYFYPESHIQNLYVFPSQTQENIVLQKFECNKLEELILSSSYKWEVSTGFGVDDDFPIQTTYVFPFVWEEVFTQFPNLKTVALRDAKDSENNDFFTTVERMGRTTCFKIENLDIYNNRNFHNYSIPTENWNLLSKTNMPNLSKLEIDIGVDVDENAFRTGLAKFAPTLKTLKIWRCHFADNLGGFPYDLQFPRMKTIELPVKCVNGFVFINYMRNLSGLTIKQSDSHPICQFTKVFGEIDFTRVRPLASVQVVTVEFRMSDEDIKNTERMFPKLTKIHMFADC